MGNEKEESGEKVRGKRRERGVEENGEGYIGGKKQRRWVGKGIGRGRKGKGNREEKKGKRERKGKKGEDTGHERERELKI